MQEEILEITRTWEYINAPPAPMQLGATPKGIDAGVGKGNNNAKEQEHVLLQQRQKDLAAEGRPMAATPKNAVLMPKPLSCLLRGGSHTTAFLLVMRIAESCPSLTTTMKGTSALAGTSKSGCCTALREVSGWEVLREELPTEELARSTIERVLTHDRHVRKWELLSSRLRTHQWHQCTLRQPQTDPVNGNEGKRSHFGTRDGQEVTIRYNGADVNVLHRERR